MNNDKCHIYVFPHLSMGHNEKLVFTFNLAEAKIEGLQLTIS